MSDQDVQIIIRSFNPQDQPFIYSTWRNQSWYSAVTTPTDSPHKYFIRKSKEIKEILETARVKIACIEDQPDVIIGYSITDKDEKHLHWVYVKLDFRGNRIATMLVPKTIESVTSELTKIGQAILDKKQGEQDARNAARRDQDQEEAGTKT